MKYTVKTTLLLLITFFSLQLAEAQQVIRGPYLQMLTTDGVTICFRTDQSIIGRVTYGTEMNNLDQTIDATTSGTDHFITITGLRPEKKYYYTIGDQSGTLVGPDANQYFITAMPAGTSRPIRLWAIGDFGKGNQKQADVRTSYTDFTGSKNTDIWLWLGDNAYDDGTDQEYQDKVFSGPYGYETILPYIPFWPTPGNHDYISVCGPFPCFTGDPATHTGPYYDIINVPQQAESGGEPSQTEVFYSFDYGNVHVLSINSEAYAWTNDSNSVLYDWIDADLDSNELEWVIAFWHQPPYSKGSHDSDALHEVVMAATRQKLAPFLEARGVDLVLSGHSHVYERSYLINGHYGTSGSWDAQTMLVDGGSGNYDDGEHYEKTLTGPDAWKGTVYVVCGNSGSSDSNPALDHPTSAFTSAGTGSLVVDIHGNRLDGMYLSSDGTVQDTFTIIKPDGSEPDTTSPNDTMVSIIDNFYNDFTDVRVYPNPFGQSTQLDFTLKQGADITVSLFNVSGQLVSTLMRGQQTAGKHSIVIDAGELNLNTGNYIIRLAVGQEVQVEKLLKLQ